MELQQLTFMRSLYHDSVSDFAWITQVWKPGIPADLPGRFVSQFKKAMLVQPIPLSPPPIQDLTSSSLRGTCNDVTSPATKTFAVRCKYHHLHGLYIIYTTSSCHSGIVGRLWHLSNLSFIELSLPESNSMSQTEQTVCLIHFSHGFVLAWTGVEIFSKCSPLKWNLRRMIHSKNPSDWALGWWFFHQAIWKICSSKMDSSGPQSSGFSNNPNIWVGTTYL